MSAPLSRSGERGESIGRPPWGLITFVLVALAIRLAIGANVHLTEDEAYYRLWAQAPAFGYYDHPPMVAWWIWLGERVAGDTPLGARLLPALACALTSLLVYDLAGMAGGEAVDARRATFWYNCMPLVVAGGFLAVPDSPAALFWTLCIWAALRAVRLASPERRARSATRERRSLLLISHRSYGKPLRTFPHDALGWWLAAGVAAGLAALSKYSSLFLGPGLLLWLVASERGRSSLRSWGPWLALATAATLFGLNVWWNQTHDWLTFAKQFGRISPHGFSMRYLPEFILTQVVLVNPALAVVLVRGRRLAPVALSVAPFIAYLSFHSLHDRIQAHWPAPVYPTLAVLAALAAGRPHGGWARLRALAPWTGLGLTAAVALYAAAPLAGIRLPVDPALPVRGWPVFARRIEALRLSAGAGWVATTSYGLAAELADEGAILAPVVQISERDRWTGLRSGVHADTRQPGLLVELARRIDLGRLRRCFAQVTPIGGLSRGPAGGAVKVYSVVVISNPRRDILLSGCGGGGAAGD